MYIVNEFIINNTQSLVARNIYITLLTFIRLKLNKFLQRYTQFKIEYYTYLFAEDKKECFGQPERNLRLHHIQGTCY